MKLLIYILLLFTFQLYSQTDPNIENKFRYAQNYEQTGQFEKAENIYRELIALQPWNYQFFDGLNRIFVKQKKYNESIQLLEERIKQSPQDINLYGMLGTSYYMLDNISAAYEAWERGLKIDPASFVIYRVIANYAVENRLFDKAIEILMRGKAFADDPMIFTLDLANIYTVNMRFDDAVKEYCSLLLIRPDQVGIVKSRIVSFIERPTAADVIINTIVNFINENKQPVLYDLLSYCYLQIGNYDEAYKAVIKYENEIKSNGNAVFAFSQDAYRNRQYFWASEGYKYLIDNFPQSQFIPNAKIAYARTLEASADQTEIDSNNWKPVNQEIIYDPVKYNDVINAYTTIANEYSKNLIHTEAVFRIAEIYMKRLHNYEKADSLYNLINEKSPQSNFSVLSFISRSVIAIKRNDLTSAKSFLENVLQNKRGDQANIAEANYYLARIKFWEGQFKESLKIFKDVINSPSTDFSNDAIELSSLISTSQKDSVNLSRYAYSDMLLFQNKLKEASIELKTLADNPNLFIINEFANYKLSNIFISENKFNEAILILEKLSENSKIAIFADKSTFLLANIYHYEIKDYQKASGYYQIILEKFPNSLYFDRARIALNSLPTNNG